MNILAAAGAVALACASCLAAAGEPLVAQAYLMGPFPERVGMLERLPRTRTDVTVTTGVNGRGRKLRHAVSVSGGVAASELPGILHAVQVDRPRHHPSQPWVIRVHGDATLVRVSFDYPAVAGGCVKHWLVARTPSSWMRLDEMDPRIPPCVVVPLAPVP